MRSMSRRTYKLAPSTVSLTDALSSFQGVEDLREQMNEWRENMEGASMEHMPKYEEVQECCETLDCYDELETSANELETLVDGLKVRGPSGGRVLLTAANITTTDMVPYKGRGEPRWMTLSNSITPVQAACQYIEEHVDEDDSEQHAEVLATARAITDLCEQLEGAEFPGMF